MAEIPPRLGGRRDPLASWFEQHHMRMVEDETHVVITDDSPEAATECVREYRKPRGRRAQARLRTCAREFMLGYCNAKGNLPDSLSGQHGLSSESK